MTSLIEDWISGVTGCNLRETAVGVWFVGDVRCCCCCCCCCDNKEEANLKKNRKEKLINRYAYQKIVTLPFMGRSLWQFLLTSPAQIGLTHRIPYHTMTTVNRYKARIDGTTTWEWTTLWDTGWCLRRIQMWGGPTWEGTTASTSTGSGMYTRPNTMIWTMSGRRLTAMMTVSRWT